MHSYKQKQNIPFVPSCFLALANSPTIVILQTSIFNTTLKQNFFALLNVEVKTILIIVLYSTTSLYVIYLKHQSYEQNLLTNGLQITLAMVQALIIFNFFALFMNPELSLILSVIYSSLCSVFLINKVSNN